MKLNKQAFTRSIGRKVLAAKRNSPHIFFVGGVAGVVGSAFLACRATLQLEDKLDGIKSDLDAVKKIKENTADDVDVSIKYLTYVSVKSVGVIGRLYGPSIVLGAVSIGALAGSHVQLTRRNTALTATLALVTKAFDDYRLRVQDEVGKEKELDIYRAIKIESVEIDGKKQLVKVSDPNGRSPYSRIFDEFSRNWVKDAETNRIFLECQQNYMNHLLRARGYVFLNDVYDSLGLDRSRAGQLVGWMADDAGDGFIDFGMYEAYNERFIKGHERSVILDFNVDGTIQDKIEE
jgi:hypothetical protein